MNRGEVFNRARYKQVVDFSGLQFERGITPTDVDGVLDFNNDEWVFFEIKYGDTAVPYGQKLALTRIVDSLESTGKPSVLLVARHLVSPELDVLAHECKVTEYYWRGVWRVPKVELNLRQAVELWRENLKINGSMRKLSSLGKAAAC